MRAPNPMSQCLPGGSCPVCNAAPDYCAACGEVEVNRPGDVCDACERADEQGDEENECDHCGRLCGDSKWCSRGCREAAFGGG